jgi:alkylation response protein AidB-like acyl-CoA dehydrogenase
MDISFDADLDAFREEVRAFLKENWSAARNPAESRDAFKARERSFRERAIEKGYLYRHVPRALGGSEQAADSFRGEIIREEFARARAPAEIASGGLSHLLPTLLEWGSEAQQRKFVEPSIYGEISWCQGYSEPNAGSDLASLRTKAELIGDEWVINGQKIWTSNAHKADWMFILVRTEPDAPKHQGISYLLINMRQPGITVRPLKQLTGKAEFNEVFLDNAKTPVDMLVGERGKGWIVSRTTLKHERASNRGLNYHEARFRDLVRLAKDSKINGKPAIEDPAIRQRLVAVEGSLACMRYSGYRQFSLEAAGEDAGMFPLLRKLYGSNIAAEMARIARDLLNDDFLILPSDGEGAGRMKWAHTNLTSMILAIAGGSSNIQRNIIAERGLGLPRDRVES